jgi:putative resolvase
MIEVLTSMCARLYGRRGARNRAVRAVTAAGHEAGAAGG